MNIKHLFSLRTLALAAVLATGATIASAATFSFSTTVDPWPDASQQSSDLEDLTISFAADTAAIGDASVTFTVIGDFNDAGEFLDVSADGFGIGRFLDSNIGTGILASPGVTINTTIALADLAPLVADGALSFLFAPTEAQQSPQGVSASLAFSISYDVADPSAVPLPAGLPLLLAGLGAFALMRRKRS